MRLSSSLTSTCWLLLLAQLSLAAVVSQRASSSAVTLTVDPSKVTQNNYGVSAMLEANLNDLTDGGLLSELLVNHAFQEDYGSLNQWTAVKSANLTLLNTRGITTEIPANVKISPGSSGIGIENPGWAGGIGVQSGAKYTSFFYAKADTAGTVPITVGVYNGDSAIGSQTIQAALTTSWQRFTTTFTPTSGSTGLSTWRLTFPQGTLTNIYVAYSSLTAPFYNGQPLRADIAKLYQQLKPVHIRLPGGNDIEGNSQADRYIWNRTIGDITTRPGRPGTWTGWNTETMGVHELLDFCELVGATAILGTYAGYSLDGSTSPDIDAIASEVVNQLHYITDTSGQWADLRKANGRAQPWDLTKVEIGNEDFLGKGPQTYQARWNTITNAIISAFGSTRFDLISTWTQITGWTYTDLHDYGKPADFIEKYNLFDNYSRTSSQRYYELEFAVINSGLGGESENDYSGPNRLIYPTLDGALAEAIYMAGMERNGDICYGSVYAPGGGSTVHNQWTPNLILWNADAAAESVSYLTQLGYSLYPASSILTSVQASIAPNSSSIYHTIGKTSSGEYLVRLINYNSQASSITVDFSGVKLKSQGSIKWQLNPTGNTNLQTANTVEAPSAMTASTGSLSTQEINAQDNLALTLPPYSFTVVTVPSA